MTLPSLPAAGSTSWYTYASALHTRAAAAITSADLDTTPVVAADFGLVAPKGVRVYANAAGQTIGNGAYPVYLDLNTTEYNEDSALYTVDLTNNKVTVASAGLYWATWSVKFATPANLTDIRDTYLTKNGGNALAVGITGVSGQNIGSSPIRLAAGDYVQLIVYVEGASVAIGSSQPQMSGLSLHRIGL